MDSNILSHFEQRDEIIFKVIHCIKPFTLEKSDNAFFSLVTSIISQQLSVKAGDTLVKRFYALVGKPLTPERVLMVSREQLRGVGMSWSKTEYIHNIARAIVEKQIDMKTLEAMPDEEVIRMLTKIKGIGRWTAEMFLMFGLAREDVFSYSDLGLQHAIQRLYRLHKRPTKRQMEKISNKWKPYRTYAANILWRSLDAESNLL